ncbi:MAG: alpha/beta hydrolase [Alphaproteobacteria bacterium]|nr:alpha/beta hydrolase [Alphaproteobacteria bacterium]
MTAPAVKLVVVAGTRVAVTRRDGAELVILTRLAGRGAGIWDGLWSRLAKRFTVANVDLSLPEGSLLDDPGAVFDGYADLTVRVARELGHPRFHVFGWNGGSHIALHAAARRSDALFSCTLLGAFSTLPDMRRAEAGVAFMRTMMNQPDKELYALYWFMSGLTPGFVEEHYDRVAALARRRAEADRFVHMDIERLTKWIKALRRHWLSDAELNRIRIPVTILAPDLDLWHAGPTVAMARALAERIPTATLEVLEDAGSLIALEDPDRIAHLFLSSLRN